MHRLVIVVVVRCFAFEREHPAEFDGVGKVKVPVVVGTVEPHHVVDDIFSG